MKENIKNRKYNGKEYDSKGNIIYKLNKEYYKNHLKFEDEYLNGKIKYGIVHNNI